MSAHPLPGESKVFSVENGLKLSRDKSLHELISATGDSHSDEANHHHAVKISDGKMEVCIVEKWREVLQESAETDQRKSHACSQHFPPSVIRWLEVLQKVCRN